MAASLNLCQFMGNLGRDPEIRSMGSGDKICNLSLAVSEHWKDRNTGERKERTEWIKVVIFNKRLVDVAEKYLRKGSRLYVSGAMQTRKWTDQSGNDRYSTEIVLQKFRGELTLLDSKSDKQQGYGGNKELPETKGKAVDDPFDDPLPF